jgi:3-hydroxyacyl-[acyl-carrier-protein] dehydratase
MNEALPPPTAVIPHREPFLFLDRCLSCDATSAVGEHTFRPDHPIFAGHFPGRPLVPAVVLIEGLAQTLAYLALRERPGALVMLTHVDGCRVRRPVAPGDTVQYEVRIERTLMGVTFATGTVRVGGRAVMSAKLRGWVGDPDADQSPDATR